jgi:hypothetical protein
MDGLPHENDMARDVLESAVDRCAFAKVRCVMHHLYLLGRKLVDDAGRTVGGRLVTITISRFSASAACTFSTTVRIVRRSLKQGMITEVIIMTASLGAGAVPAHALLRKPRVVFVGELRQHSDHAT